MRVPELTVVLLEPEAEPGRGAGPYFVFAEVPVPEPEAVNTGKGGGCCPRC